MVFRVVENRGVSKALVEVTVRLVSRTRVLLTETVEAARHDPLLRTWLLHVLLLLLLCVELIRGDVHAVNKVADFKRFLLFAGLLDLRFGGSLDLGFVRLLGAVVGLSSFVA